MYRKLGRSAGNVHGYEITSAVTHGEAKRLAQELEAALATGGKIRLLFELHGAAYRDLGALWEDLKFDAKHLREMERIAVVGESSLAQAATRAFGLLTPVECRFFDRGEADRAWAWVAA